MAFGRKGTSEAQMQGVNVGREKSYKHGYQAQWLKKETGNIIGTETVISDR